jgi:hypothetical protein
MRQYAPLIPTSRIGSEGHPAGRTSLLLHPSMRAQTLARGSHSDHRTAGGGRPGDIAGESYCSAGSPADRSHNTGYGTMSGPDYRMGSRHQSGSGLRPDTRPQLPMIPEAEFIFIIPGAAKRHERLE